MLYNIDNILEHYIVYANGEIYDIDKNKYVSTHVTKRGYLAFYCKEIKSDILVHRFVMYYFQPIDNMENLQVNHKDGNKQNNNINNLEWCTCSENLLHAFLNNLKTQVGENNSLAKLKEKDVVEIIGLLVNGVKVTEIANIYNVKHQTISNIKLHKSWTHLTDGINFPNIKKTKVKSSTTRA